MFADRLRPTPHKNRFLAGLLAGGLALGFAAQAALADDDEEIPFDEAEIFFELNNTDEDLGIHALIDGDAWKRLEIEDPKGRKMLDIRVRGRLRKQGLTELFFESAEPNFGDLSPDEFFDRFPEGEYEIEGKTLDGLELESETMVTHLMPAPPEPEVNDQAAAEDCDAVLPIVSAPVTITWPEVKLSHPDLGRMNEPITINNYQLVVEVETTDEQEVEFSFILPPGETSVTVPEAFTGLDADGEVKYEVLAREESFNQTATESCFCIDGADCDEENGE